MMPPFGGLKHLDSVIAMHLFAYTYGCVVHELDEVTVDEGSLRRLGIAYRFPWVLCFPPYSRFQALMSIRIR